MKMSGAKMGYRHFSPQTARTMVHMISQSFHESLINYILATDLPIGMIIDGSVSAEPTITLIVLNLSGPWLGHNRPLTLPEPEPTLPFDLPLSEPTYQHRPDLTAFLSPIFC